MPILPFRIPGGEHGCPPVKGGLSAVVARPKSSGLWHLGCNVGRGHRGSLPEFRHPEDQSAEVGLPK